MKLSAKRKSADSKGATDTECDDGDEKMRAVKLARVADGSRRPASSETCADKTSRGAAESSYTRDAAQLSTRSGEGSNVGDWGEILGKLDVGFAIGVLMPGADGAQRLPSQFLSSAGVDVFRRIVRQVLPSGILLNGVFDIIAGYSAAMCFVYAVITHSHCSVFTSDVSSSALGCMPTRSPPVDFAAGRFIRDCIWCCTCSV